MRGRARYRLPRARQRRTHARDGRLALKKEGLEARRPAELRPTKVGPSPVSNGGSVYCERRCANGASHNLALFAGVVNTGFFDFHDQENRGKGVREPGRGSRNRRRLLQRDPVPRACAPIIRLAAPAQSAFISARTWASIGALHATTLTSSARCLWCGKVGKITGEMTGVVVPEDHRPVGLPDNDRRR